MLLTFHRQPLGAVTLVSEISSDIPPNNLWTLRALRHPAARTTASRRKTSRCPCCYTGHYCSFVVTHPIFQRKPLTLQHFQARFRPAVSTCRTEGREESFVIKLVPEAYSDMIWREFYMYEMVLKGMFPRSQASRDVPRPVGGWFAFCLEDVGDNLEKTYGLDWSEVKMTMPRIQW